MGLLSARNQGVNFRFPRCDGTTFGFRTRVVECLTLLKGLRMDEWLTLFAVRNPLISLERVNKS